MMAQVGVEPTFIIFLYDLHKDLSASYIRAQRGMHSAL